MVRVKICGITKVKDARLAARLGADALGFNFYKGSPRYIKPERARAIIAALPPFVSSVGIFVNEDPDHINEIARICALDAVQLHGDQPPAQFDRIRGARRIKAIAVQDEHDIALCRRYRADAFLLDAWAEALHGGTGETFNWQLVREAHQFGPIILAGGLTAENVDEAIRITRPYAVDVASGVEERPGIKDRYLMEDFILCAKAAGD